MSNIRSRAGVWVRRSWLTALLVGSLSMAAGCGAEPDPGPANDTSTTGGAVATGSFAGRVSGTDALLALLSNGERVAGYLCDGDDVSVWLRSEPTNGNTVNLLGRDGTVHGSITVSPEAATGTVDIDGTPHEVTLLATQGDAGLYRAFADLGDAGTVEAGWILLDENSQTGAINTRTPGGSVVVNPAPPLDPAASSVNLTRFGDLAIQHLTPGFVEKIVF